MIAVFAAIRDNPSSLYCARTHANHLIRYLPGANLDGPNRRTPPPPKLSKHTLTHTAPSEGIQNPKTSFDSKYCNLQRYSEMLTTQASVIVAIHVACYVCIARYCFFFAFTFLFV